MIDSLLVEHSWDQYVDFKPMSESGWRIVFFDDDYVDTGTGTNSTIKTRVYPLAGWTVLARTSRNRMTGEDVIDVDNEWHPTHKVRPTWVDNGGEVIYLDVDDPDFFCVLGPQDVEPVQDMAQKEWDRRLKAQRDRRDRINKAAAFCVKYGISKNISVTDLLTLLIENKMISYSHSFDELTAIYYAACNLMDTASRSTGSET